MRRIIYTIFFLFAPFINIQDEHDIQRSIEPSIDFILRIDPESHNNGTFYANTSAFDEITLLKPRTIPLSSADNSAEIKCVIGNSTKSIIYGQAEECDRLEWIVTFDC